jgi:hypothetical protein
MGDCAEVTRDEIKQPAFVSVELNLRILLPVDRNLATVYHGPILPVAVLRKTQV